MYLTNIIKQLIQLCGIICVQSLWSAWMEEKSIFKSLQELQSHGGVTGLSQHTLGIPGHHMLRSSLRHPPGYTTNGLGYNNPAFSASTPHIAGGGVGLGLTNYHNKTPQYIKS